MDSNVNLYGEKFCSTNIVYSNFILTLVNVRNRRYFSNQKNYFKKYSLMYVPIVIYTFNNTPLVFMYRCYVKSIVIILEFVI